MWSGLCAAAAIAGGCVGTVAYGVAGRSAQLFGPSVCRGHGNRRSIALTFDDGPSEGSVRLIEYLAQQEIKGTFFQCGMNVQRRPEISRAIRDAGHEIGNHTYSHAQLCPSLTWKPNFRSPAFIDEEFSKAQQIIQAEAGITPVLMRAPYGLRWYGVGAVQRRLHLLGVMWTVIGHDWEWPADRVAELVLRKASPGGIVCLHDGRDVRVAPNVSQMLLAVKKIVPVLKDRGYSFESVSELLRADRHPIDKLDLDTSGAAR